MKKNFEKIIGLILAAVMVFALTACGDPGVKEYVDEHGQELITAFETSLSAGGLTCKSTIKADGNKIVVDTNIDQLEDLSEDEKQQLQQTFDGMNGQMKSSFGNVKEEIKDLEAVIFNIREKDGDLAAKIELRF